MAERARTIIGLAAVAAVVAIGRVAPLWTLSLATVAASDALVALGIVVLARTGNVSFGQGLFFAAGGYGVALMANFWGVSDALLQVLVGAACGGLLGLLIGPLLARYTGIFFGMLTLAFGMLFHSFLFKFYAVTGGDQGMRVLRPLLLGMEWRGGKTAFLTGPFYYYALILFALLGLAMWRMTQSPFGLHLRAIRENAGKAAYVGVEIFRMRLAAFVISAVYGGIGGTILAVTTGLADPELAYWTHSGNLVFMAVLGGSGTFAGPAIGALVFVVLQDFVMAVTQYWRFVMGSVLVLLVIFMPQGLAGTIGYLVARRDGEG